MPSRRSPGFATLAQAQKAVRAWLEPWREENFRAPAPMGARTGEDTALAVENTCSSVAPPAVRLRFFVFVWEAAALGRVDLDDVFGDFVPWRVPSAPLTNTEIAKLALLYGHAPSRWRGRTEGQIAAELAVVVKRLRLAPHLVTAYSQVMNHARVRGGEILEDALPFCARMLGTTTVPPTQKNHVGEIRRLK